MSKINIDELLEILPKLIREDDRVKGAIISALSGVVATHEDIVKLTEQMDKRFEAMDKRFEAMDKRFEQMQATMDKRFEQMQATMDKRFETMDKRFEQMQATMDKRFEAMDRKMDRNYTDLKSILNNIQNALGKPFEQFGRNVIVKLLQSEGYEKIKLKSKMLKDPDRFVSPGISQVEIDGFSLEPPVIAEITSILRAEEKVNLFLKKKEFVETKYDRKFRGFFVAATSELSAEEMGDLTIKLRDHNCELINL